MWAEVATELTSCARYSAPPTLANEIDILLGDGDGTFTNSGSLPTNDSPMLLTVDDLNGSNHDDVVVGNQFSDNVSVWLGNGDGTFQPRDDYAAGDGAWGMGLPEDGVELLHPEDVGLVVHVAECDGYHPRLEVEGDLLHLSTDDGLLDDVGGSQGRVAGEGELPLLCEDTDLEDEAVHVDTCRNDDSG